MYTYTTAIARPLGRNTRYQYIAADTMTLASLLNDYSDVKIQLSHTIEPGTFVLDINTARTEMTDVSITFAQWLISVGNRLLDVSLGVVSINTKTIRYKCGLAAGYLVNHTKMGTHPDTPWTDCVMRDLLLTKNNIDYFYFQDNCLVTVNGLLHRTSASEHGVYVVDGAYSNIAANLNTLGIMNFDKLGSVKTYPITPEMISLSSINSSLYNKTFIELPVNVNNKTVLLSIGGYLHVLDDVYRQISDTAIVVDFSKIQLLERHYESKDVIDLSSIEYVRGESILNQVAVDEIIKSNQYIRGLLALTQSFVIVVDTPHLYTQYHRLEKLPLPGSFIVDTVPLYPLRTANGRLPEYHSIRDNDKYVIRCVSNAVPNYQFTTTNWQDNDTASSGALPNNPYFEDRGYLLEIGKDI